MPSLTLKMMVPERGVSVDMDSAFIMRETQFDCLTAAEALVQIQRAEPSNPFAPPMKLLFRKRATMDTHVTAMLDRSFSFV